MPEPLVTLREAAHHVGRPLGTVRTWRRRGLLRPVGRQKNRDLFRLAEIVAVAARMAESPRHNHGGGRTKGQREPTEEQLEALIADRRKKLPKWWSHAEAQRPARPADCRRCSCGWRWPGESESNSDAKEERT